MTEVFGPQATSMSCHPPHVTNPAALVPEDVVSDALYLTAPSVVPDLSAVQIIRSWVLRSGRNGVKKSVLSTIKAPLYLHS